MFGGGLQQKHCSPLRNSFHGVIPNVNADGIINYITEPDCKSAEVF
jgi:hypothetical protein